MSQQEINCQTKIQTEIRMNNKNVNTVSSPHSYSENHMRQFKQIKWPRTVGFTKYQFPLSFFSRMK